MKKALIITKVFGGKQIGSIERISDSFEIDSLNGNHYNKMEKVTVPTELENIPVNQLQSQYVSHTDSYYSDGTTTYNYSFDVPLVDDGNGNLIGDTSFIYYPAIPAHWEIIAGSGLQDYNKNKRINEKRDILKSETLSEMKTVYNTDSPDNAIANYLTWLSMASNPARFASQGIVAKAQAGGLMIGDALDSNKKVSDYAEALLSDAIDYAVWRELKIQTFSSDKAAIEAE